MAGKPTEVDDRLGCRHLIQMRAKGKRRTPILAVESCRDTLSNRCLKRRIREKVSPGVTVDVDEAGRDDEATGVDTNFRLGCPKVADGGDPISRDADVRSPP